MARRPRRSQGATHHTLAEYFHNIMLPMDWVTRNMYHWRMNRHGRTELAKAVADKFASSELLHGTADCLQASGDTIALPDGPRRERRRQTTLRELGFEKKARVEY
jgi:hypothetical protein